MTLSKAELRFYILAMRRAELEAIRQCKQKVREARREIAHRVYRTGGTFHEMAIASGLSVRSCYRVLNDTDAWHRARAYDKPEVVS